MLPLSPTEWLKTQKFDTMMQNGSLAVKSFEF